MFGAFSAGTDSVFHFFFFQMDANYEVYVKNNNPKAHSRTPFHRALKDKSGAIPVRPDRT